MPDIEIIKMVHPKLTKSKRSEKVIKRKRKRTSSGLIEKSETMKGTETEFEEFVIDRTITPQRKLKVEDVQKSEQGTGSTSQWRQQLERTLLGNVSDPKSVKTPARPRKSCFNCNGEHNLRECPKPKNFHRIAKKRRESGGEMRRKYETIGISQQKQTNYKPGELSQRLREALSLGNCDIPEHIYRMRRLGFIKGYPPGYLKKAIKSTDIIKVFSSESADHDGEVTIKPPELDMAKIICYPGFNGDSSKLNDREMFKVPPIHDFCAGYQEELTEIFKRQRKSEKRKSRLAAKHKKFTNDDDDDDVIIIENEKVKSEQDKFNTPGEEGLVVLLDGTGKEEKTPKTPIRKDVNMGGSMFESIGTPIFVQNVTPVAPLEAFAAGIQPFQAQVEEVENKGIFRKLMDSLKKARERNPADSEIQEISYESVIQKPQDVPKVFNSVSHKKKSKKNKAKKAPNEKKKSQKKE